MIFPKYYTDQLTEIFLKKERASPTQSSSGSVEGEQMDEDVDGELMDDVDGEPLDDIGGEPMDDVDGEPMDDVDGEPMEDDMVQHIQSQTEVQNLFTEVKDMFA